jgi:acetylornithine deacetylase/succinyl-diaminopimelate desuccinylase-like protein
LTSEESLAAIESRIHPHEVLELAREMVRIPSSYTEEAGMSRFVLSKLSEWGFEPRAVPVEDHGDCVVAEFGDPDLPAIVLNGHMDTVKVADGWTRDPYSADVEEGYLVGLGSSDMKSGLAALMVAFRALRDSGLMEKHRLVFQAVSGEEDIGAGTKKLISSGEFKGASAVIVGEGIGGYGVVTNSRRGGSYYDIVVKGRSAHGANPEKGINAVVDASRIACMLDTMPLPQSKGLTGDDSTPLGETQTVLRIEGGTTSLSVPDRCTIKVVRLAIPGGKRDYSEELSAEIGKLDLKSEVTVTLRLGTDEPYSPYVTDPKSALVAAVRTAVERYTGATPRPLCGLSEADDNLISAELGLPVVCVGPGERHEVARYHQPDEWISVEQLEYAAQIYCAAVLNLDSVSR